MPARDALAGHRRAALSGYRDRGVGLLPGLLPSERVCALREESLRLWQVFEPQGAANLRVGIRVEPSGQVVLNGLDPVSDVSPVFAAVNADPLLVALAEKGLGGPVTTMKDKLIYKWPGTRGFGLHRDADYNTPKSGVPASEFLTVCIALDPVTPARGPVEFYPELRDRRTPAAPDEARDVDEGAMVGLRSVSHDLEPGDAILFDGRVPHRSDRNTSDGPRRLYMVTYVPARHAGAREHYYAAREREQAAERRGLPQG
jgi:2-aminoethylphosphonate dioxygenase